jgi:hypothetical protein
MGALLRSVRVWDARESPAVGIGRAVLDPLVPCIDDPE